MLPLQNQEPVIAHPCGHLGCPKEKFWWMPGGPDNGIEILEGDVFYVMFFPHDFVSFYSGLRKSVEHSGFFSYTTPFSAAKVRCASFGQLLYWPVTRRVWVIFFIRLLGVEPTGKSTDKSTEVHKKSRGPRTMNQVKTGCQRG